MESSTALPVPVDLYLTFFSTAYQNQIYQGSGAFYNYADPAGTDTSGGTDYTGWSNASVCDFYHLS